MDGRHTTSRRTRAARRLTVAVGALLPAALLPIGASASVASAAPPPASATTAASERVIVRSPQGHLAEAEALVDTLGGTVTLDLSLIDGFAAQVPAGALEELARSPLDSSVTPDGSVHMNDDAFPAGYGALDPTKQAGSL